MRKLQVLVLALLLFGSAAQAEFPSRPIQWIVPYPAGGGSDAIGRALAQALQGQLGAPVVVENKPGASTNIAVAALLQAKPDGHTLMQAQEAALALNPHLFKKLPYAPQRDFSPIGAIARLPVALVVDAALPVHTLKDLLSHMAAHPGKAAYASPGVGTPHHLAMELFKKSAGVSWTAVPYRGGAAALADVVGGHVPVMMLDLGTGLQSIKAGKVRVLAVASLRRAQALPDVPTLEELGHSSVSVEALQALIGPAGMAEDTVRVLNQALNKALHEPQVRRLLADIGAEALPGTPLELRQMAQASSARWGPIIRDLRLSID
jgi:tripartite-type tricarboxylate transporter receptor subunit TctC